MFASSRIAHWYWYAWHVKCEKLSPLLYFDTKCLLLIVNFTLFVDRLDCFVLLWCFHNDLLKSAYIWAVKSESHWLTLFMDLFAMKDKLKDAFLNKDEQRWRLWLKMNTQTQFLFFLLPRCQEGCRVLEKKIQICFFCRVYFCKRVCVFIDCISVVLVH